MSEVSANPGDDDGGKNAEAAAPAASASAVDAGGEQEVANDVQRAIEGLKGMQDDELQEFLNDDFMKDLDVVDAWGGDEERAKKDTKSARQKDRPRVSRERSRRDRKSPHSRERPKREDRRREDARRDPSKSSKDIERDKIRTKKDTDSKILAEKEKAIKHLLDSDDVVPPGTEVEAIQIITEKHQITAERGQQQQQQQTRSRRSRDRRRSQERTRPSPTRRRSNDRIRLSPHRRISDERRQIRLSPEQRRRNAASPPNLRRSWERRASRDRSIERHRRREEREQRLASRRSRSRDRQRSRSSERYRKRWSSRSPVGRRASPRRHSRSRSRSPERRARKRSPFINELARTFRNEGLIPGGPSNFLPGIPPLMGQGFPHDRQTAPIAPVPPLPFMHHPPGPPQMHMQQPGGPQQQPPPPPFAGFEPHMNFEPGPMPMPMAHGDYTAGPIMYNQGNAPMQPPSVLVAPNLPMPMQSPQPVPAPTEHPTIGFNQQTRCVVNIPVNAPQPPPPPPPQQQQHAVSAPRKSFKDTKSTATTTHNGAAQTRTERLKTPEPPIISKPKPFEKTSLSSLLEASVSAKDSLGLPVLYPGFKPEILRQCELALRDLPAEDLRLKKKGRFFYDPYKEDAPQEPENLASNSILLRTGRSRIYWEEAAAAAAAEGTQISHPRPAVEMHQKICQTDETETESRGVQAIIKPATKDFCVQVSTYDLQQAAKAAAKEEKRPPIMDRLDWNVRDNSAGGGGVSGYDYVTKIREADDLRWSLSNSSQKRPWNSRLASPPPLPLLLPPLSSSSSRVIDEERELSPSSRLSASDHGSRGLNVGSSTRSQDNYSSYHRSTSRERYSRDRYSPTYRRSVERGGGGDFLESRSDRSRGESPMVLEDSPDEIEILAEEHYPRGSSDWRPRGKSTYNRPGGGGGGGTVHKLRAMRGKPAGRPYNSRGSYRGKF